MVAVNGFAQKHPNTNPNDYINYRPVLGDATIGWIWNEDSETWSSPSAVLVTIEEVRAIRTRMLLESDWVVAVSDYPNSDKDEWIAYRQLLRDYPATYTPVEQPIWPAHPV